MHTEEEYIFVWHGFIEGENSISWMGSQHPQPQETDPRIYNDAELMNLLYPPMPSTALKIVFSLTVYNLPQKSFVFRKIIDVINQSIENSGDKWIFPNPWPSEEWLLDLDELKKKFVIGGNLSKQLSGKVIFTPYFGYSLEDHIFPSPEYYAYLSIDISPKKLKAAITSEERSFFMQKGYPLAINESLEAFLKDHPDPGKTAFIMMQFGQTTAHTKIVEAIRTVLSKHGIEALRADDKQYHDDLFPNVLTYIHGCRFGIAVFERIENDLFNPNVALEVGQMQALGKPVCYLKDRTLTSLHADLIGKLYREFDPLNPKGTIPPALEGWVKDKGIIPPSPMGPKTFRITLKAAEADELMEIQVALMALDTQAELSQINSPHGVKYIIDYSTHKDISISVVNAIVKSNLGNSQFEVTQK